MHLFQKAKGARALFRKAQATKLSLLLFSALLCATAFSLAGGAGPAYAASIISSSVVQPACTTGVSSAIFCF